MKISNRHLMSIAVVGTVSVLAVGCGSSKTSSSPTTASGGSATSVGSATSATSAGSAAAAPSGAVYKIGLTTDLTGPVAEYGKAMLNAWQAEINMVNDSGGIDGHKLKLISLDDQSDPAKAHANFLQLTQQDHVLVVQGPVFGNVCSALAPLATAGKVPMLCNAASSDLLSPVHPYVYDEYDSEVTFAQPALTWAKTHFNKAGLKVLVVSGDIPAIEAMAQRVQQTAGQYGATVVKTVTEPQTPDMGALAATISATKPDVVIAELAASDFTSLQRDLQTNGSAATVLALDNSYPAWETSSNPGLLFELNQVAFVNPASALPAVQSYVKYMGKLGVSGAANLNPANGVIYYSAAADVVAALQKCGSSCTSQSLQTAMDSVSVNLPGVTDSGGFGWSATSHIPNTKITMYKWDKATSLPVVDTANLPLGQL